MICMFRIYYTSPMTSSEINGQSPASLSSLLEAESGSLNTLIKKAKLLVGLQEYMRVALGPPLGQHLAVANLSAGNLTLYSDSPAWAARLRFKIPDMYRIAENYGFGNLKSVRIKVIRVDSARSTPKASLFLSGQAAAQVLRTASSIDDERLRESLERLGTHNRPTSHETPHPSGSRQRLHERNR
ncbi:MAG: DUF721 domain-containing protein [Gammaproteobacteria bacterium]|nr:MAG: DUF721 domain-containing protein [Gammaproteobacteria bacterium]